ncbi:MAG: serine hydrolase domain-containing protein [Gemmatimonadota bacterium]
MSGFGPLRAGRQLLAVGWVIGVAAVPATGQQPSKSNRFEAAWTPVREFFHTTLNEQGVVGGAILFFHGDTTLAHDVHGFADLATGRKVDARTIFHYGSITKTLTGIGIMQMKERGRLSVADPIVKYLPELRQVHDSFGDVGEITLRHLMSHSSGFRNPTWPWGGDKPWHPFEPTEWSQLVAMLPYTEILFKPGSRYSYSNPGVIFLGKVLEQLSGDDYETYIDKNIFKPLGMYESYYDLTPYHLLPQRSNNYDLRSGTPVPNGLDFDTGITTANGGLNAPLTDMAKYLKFLVGAPGLSAAARGVLKPETLREMWQPVVPAGQEGPAKTSVGLSFFVLELPSYRLIGHTGSQAAFRAFFYVQPESETGVIAVFNTAAADDPRNPTDTAAKPNIGLIFSGLLERLTGGVFPLYVR